LPGAYTHMTIVELLTSGKSLNNMKLPKKGRSALMAYPEFCNMGAISPDYPYLRLAGDSEEAEEWANAMHHKYGTQTEGNILHLGIKYITQLTGDNQLKCFAWFLGYASHIIVDVTLHPMTNLLVGDYEANGNAMEHRVSEMHQDVYIYKTRLNGDVRKSEKIKNVIGTCADQDDKNKVDSTIEKMWRYMLSKAFPSIYAELNPNIHGWHGSVQFFIDNVGEELSFIPSRHIREFFEEKGVAYPRYEDVKLGQYISELKTPKGIKTYDQVFDHAKRNVSKVWKIISAAVFTEDNLYESKLKMWNLDIGQEVNTPKVMWEDTL